MMELYTVNENGQMEMNFDSLGMKTSIEFSNRVKAQCEFNKCEIKSVIESNYLISIYMVNHMDIWHVYTFNYETQWIHDITVPSFMLDQLNVLRGRV